MRGGAIVHFASGQLLIQSLVEKIFEPAQEIMELIT